MKTKEEGRYGSNEGNGAEAKNSRRSYGKLDDRYGKIGISAVAAAVRHQGESRNAREPTGTAVDDR